MVFVLCYWFDSLIFMKGTFSWVSVGKLASKMTTLRCPIKVSALISSGRLYCDPQPIYNNIYQLTIKFKIYYIWHILILISIIALLSLSIYKTYSQKLGPFWNRDLDFCNNKISFWRLNDRKVDDLSLWCKFIFNLINSLII